MLPFAVPVQYLGHAEQLSTCCTAGLAGRCLPSLQSFLVLLFTLTFELISSGCRRFRRSLLKNNSTVTGHLRLFWLGLPRDDVEHLISGATGRVPCSPPRAPLQPEHR